jgi:hypothetical protein
MKNFEEIIENEIRQSEITSRRAWYYILNDKLIKKKKPCFDGDYIHLHSRDGCFRVQSVCVHGIHILKNGKLKMVKWSDFRCLKGQGVSELKLLKQTKKEIMIIKHLLSEINETLGRI